MSMKMAWVMVEMIADSVRKARSYENENEDENENWGIG